MEKVKLQLEVSEQAKRNLKIHAVLTEQSMSDAIDEILVDHLARIRAAKNTQELESHLSDSRQAREA